MHTHSKEHLVNEIRGRLVNAPLIILTDFQGSTVRELEQVRRACLPVGVHVQVVKNSLCRRAVDGTALQALAPHFKGNIAVVISGEDPTATAKMFRDQAKSNQKLVIRAGFFDGDVIDEKGVGLVADLPSKATLLSTLLRTIQTAPMRLMNVVQAPGRDLVYLLNNYANKLEKQG